MVTHDAGVAARAGRTVRIANGNSVSKAKTPFARTCARTSSRAAAVVTTSASPFGTSVCSRCGVEAESSSCEAA